ncbi:MAG TPA: citrate/2-methylcitrate synthase, partial [Bryobacteraceae bacterium]|nr:citrate/2-methylcitrate synthase [Bryobacteraceae bacterium]
MSDNRLTITDHRTGAQYEVPIVDGNIRATDLRKIKVTPGEFGMMTYDPAYLNTAWCRSAITFIDGDKGILRYRGYPIEELAEKCTFLEVAWLLMHGEFPAKDELVCWEQRVMRHCMIHETSKHFLESFRYDAHPMTMLISTVAALSNVYPEAKNIHDPANRER